MPSFVAGDRNVTASIPAAVVGQDPLDRDPVIGREAPGSLEEAGRRSRCFIGELLRVGQPAVVVDREVDPVPADPAMPIDLDASDPAAASGSDPAEHLGVEVDDSPGRSRS